jgi:hypothetical protein
MCLRQPSAEALFARRERATLSYVIIICHPRYCDEELGASDSIKVLRGLDAVRKRARLTPLSTALSMGSPPHDIASVRS